MTTQCELKTTPLCNACKAAGGKMVDFHGWLLPVQFAGIIAEHKAVRENAGMFDVSHMGQIFVEGKDAWRFLQHINCNNIKNTPAAGTYSHILTERGTIIDDAISFCLNAEKFLVVVNAACIDEDFRWFQKQAAGFDVSVRNESSLWGMIAVQGPLSLEKVGSLIENIADLPRFNIKEIELFGVKGFVTRTGYTGEDGVEIMLPSEKIENLWAALLEKGVIPCGLGSRDVLRLEAGYLLNGADADQSRTPYEANCGWVVKLSKEEFVGKDALTELKEKGFPEKLTGFILKSAGVPRAGCKVFVGSEQKGFLTSGTFSPLFKGIAVGYLSSDIALGSEVEIEIHAKRVKAEVVKPPFYKNRV